MLKEDREKLRAMQKSQPHFTEGQRQELLDVHPWLRGSRLPAALDLMVSSGCLCALPTDLSTLSTPQTSKARKSLFTKTNDPRMLLSLL